MVGLLGLNWPLLEVFYTEVALYLFLFWFLLIVLTAGAAYKYNNSKDQQTGESGARKPLTGEGGGPSSSADFRAP